MDALSQFNDELLLSDDDGLLVNFKSFPILGSSRLFCKILLIE